MLSEVKLESVIRDKPQPKYYVYFDDWSGEITDITNKPIESESPYIITPDETASKIMMGIINPKKYVVADLVDGRTLVLKKDAIRIKQAENYLSKVPKVPYTIDSDINVIFYVNDWLMEVNINQDTMYKLTGKRFNYKLDSSANAQKSEMDLFIIKHNDPSYLVERIKIDPIELMNQGYMLFDLSHLKTTIGLNSLDVLTKRIFKTYGLKYKQNYVKLDYHTNISVRRNHVSIQPESEEWAMFSVSASTAGWILRSNFRDPNEQKIYKDIHIYLTGDDPHHLYDKITIPYGNIGWDKEYVIRTQVDPAKCKLLLGEEGKNLTFKFEDLEYVKPGKY
jgi:hypothetical protein